MRDLCNNIQVKRAISPVSVTDNTAQVSQIIDRQGYESLTFLMLIGSVGDADATFTTLVEESDAANMSGAVAVDDADLITQTPGTAPETAASFTFAADDNVRKIGYRGNKRYVRLTITPANNSATPSAALLAAAAVLGHPWVAPVAQATA